MFSKAYKIATKYTRPVVVSTRTYDGEVSSGCAAYIVLNEEGWIMTAYHVISGQLAMHEHKPLIDAFETEKKKILGNANLKQRQKDHRISELKPNKKWVTNHSFWWGKDNLKIDTFYFFTTGDIAIGKIIDYVPEVGMEYPRFITPEKIKFATSLCKLGFPFHDIKSTFTNNGFVLQEGSLPIPFFPIEGILTREINISDQSNATGFPAKFIETSSPGLKGQSGGPIFDKKGNVWGIQVSTSHFSLGFNPKVKGGDGNEVEEHQFLNVGWGAHPELILSFLSKHNVKYYEAG